tara:strand:- start:994 stop:1299 length:306 start_codon:yes stop_codon:yes gene_type:complete
MKEINNKKTIMDLFSNKEKIDQNKEWEKEWNGMPSYNNVKTKKPFITATFKFRNQEDFDFFNNFLKKELYKEEKIFDGMQRKDKKSTWYPLNEKASKFIVL